MPPKLYLSYHEDKGDLRTMPCYLEGLEVSAVKIVNYHPENPKKFGLSTVMATIILTDLKNGQPLAIMGGRNITAMRAGAAGGIAAKYLARKTLGLLVLLELWNSKERMLTAFRNQQPDMVPVSPDISNMIPAKLTGKPFWDIYLYGDPPLWKARIEAIKWYKIDGYLPAHLGPLIDPTKALKPINKSDKRRFRNFILNKTSNAITVRTYCITPKGELWSETVFYRGQPPWLRRKYFKDFEMEFDHLQYFLPRPFQSKWRSLLDCSEYNGRFGNNWLNHRASRVPRSFWVDGWRS